MTGRYQAYPEYKDSTIDWLEQIPSHWTTTKLKFQGDAIIGLTYNPAEVVGSDNNSSTLVLRSSNVQNQRITLNDNVFVDKQIPDKLKTKLNDILICSRNGSRALIGKNAKIDRKSIGMTFGAFMTIFRSKYNFYLSHVFNSKLFEYQSGSFLTSTINQLTTGNLKSFEIPFPPDEELKPIAAFLDYEKTKIDTLIAKQEKLVELLKEKRQAVISQAATKGLNPNVPMKDSGVEWLGEVPEHWNVSPIKFLVTYNDDVLPDSTDDSYEIEYIDIGSVSSNEGIQKTESYEFSMAPSRARRIVKRSDVIVSTVRTYLEAIAVVNKEQDNLIVSTGFCVIRPKKLKDIFAGYALRTRFFIAEVVSRSVGISYPAINSSELVNIKVAYPSENEQIAIGNYIEDKCKQLDLLSEKCESVISLMLERKKSLISAVITGKIDVRNWRG